MRARAAVVVFAVVVATLFASVAVDPATTQAGDVPAADRLVAPDGTDGHVWPYTSRSRSVDGRTLAINVVVRAGPDDLRRALVDRSAVNWTAVDDDGTVDVEPSPWGPARGAARYTYVTPARDAAGTWVRAEYQLGTGPYLGRRVHIRAYPAPSGEWTAVQAHAEYWDWFRLRHTVTGIRPGARLLERSLRGEPFVADVDREYHGLGGGGSDGWLTTVEFAVPLALVGATGTIARARARLRGRDGWRLADVALPVALAGVVLGVRAAGLALEGWLPTADPRLFAVGLYALLVAGPPAVVARLARERPPERTATLAAAGLGAGVLADLAVVGLRTLPVRMTVHRIALCGSLGLFALGVARGDRRTAAAGLGVWTLALAAALAGYV